MKNIILLFISLIMFIGCNNNKKETINISSWKTENQDSLFNDVYIDIDEWREKPVKHRYIHGGFKNTDTRFSYYFPEKENYEGRFFQYQTPVPDNENLSQGLTGEEDRIGFALTHGAYFIETNGGGNSTEKNVNAYRANAACAQFSRVVAKQILGGSRPYGYIYGGSGGAYRTMGCMENTNGVWDGGVPYVVGSPMAIPNSFTARMFAMQVLSNKFPQIVDATEPGGGDIYEGLTPEEKAVLIEATKLGFPSQSWYAYKNMGVHGFVAVYQGMLAADPSYFEKDFWNTSGYLGADDPDFFKPYLIQQENTIDEILSQSEAEKIGIVEPVDETERGTADMAWKNQEGAKGEKPIAFRLKNPIKKVNFLGGDLIFQSGEIKDKFLQLSAINEHYVILGPNSLENLAKVHIGDEVSVDNSNFLASQTYHRHQVPKSGYPVYDQFRKADGTPIYPQRPMLLGPMFASSPAGSVPNGKVNGKIIILSSLWDREAYAWMGDWYYNAVKNHFGSKAEDNVRLWYTDHADHNDARITEYKTYVVSYLGVLQQALLDISGWVEKGIEPPHSSNYTVEDGQVLVSNLSSERKGIQPIPQLFVNKSKATTVSVGEPVTFDLTIDLPENTGEIIEVSFDFDGTGNFQEILDLDNLNKDDFGILSTHLKHTFKTEGTHFVTVKVTSQRNGNGKTHFTRIHNLDKNRVNVEK
jgi:hypothetical protein